MRIQTEHMSFKNCWTISSSYDFQALQEPSQRRWWYSQTALPWFDMLPGLLSALPSFWSTLRGFWSALPGLTPVLPSAARCTRRPLLPFSKLWDLTTLRFWSDNSQTLPEAPSNQNTFCWCTWEWQWQVLEHLESQLSSPGKATSSLEMLLAHLESLQLLVIEQFLKLMYSVCILISVSMYLLRYPSTHGISELAACSAWEHFDVHFKTGIE
jgi:hypothetical protein